MSLDEASTDIAYNLGRLFAAFYYAEKTYADRNATIRDKYMGSASATPARVFPILMRGYEHNRSALAKSEEPKRSRGRVADQAVSRITGQLDGAINLPATLTMDQQARFFIGYYHQEQQFYRGKATDSNDTATPASVQED